MLRRWDKDIADRIRRNYKPQEVNQGIAEMIED